MISRGNAVRAANDRVAQRAKSLRFASRVPMRCECNDPGCQALIPVSLEDFHRLRASGVAVIAEDHEPFAAPRNHPRTAHWPLTLLGVNLHIH